MAYKALKSFAGVINMKRGEVKEINNEALVNELLRIGYIADMNEKPRAVKSSKPTKKVKGGEE